MSLLSGVLCATREQSKRGQLQLQGKCTAACEQGSAQDTSGAGRGHGVSATQSIAQVQQLASTYALLLCAAGRARNEG